MDVYLDMGYTDINAYWRMTLSEITALLDAGQRRMQREKEKRDVDIKQNAIMLRNLSLQVGDVISCMFDKDRHTLTPLSEYYPGLFTREEETKEMSLEAYTALFEDFAYRHNERRKKRLGGDTNESVGYNAEEVAGNPDR